MSQAMSQVCRKLVSRDVASLDLKGVDQLICGSFARNEFFILHAFQVTLQATAVYLGTELFKVLDGQFIVFQQVL